MSLRPSVAFVCLAGLVAAPALAVSTSPAPLKVTSSLDGKTAAPAPDILDGLHQYP